MSSSSSQPQELDDETDYHIQHFSDGNERFVHVGNLMDMLRRMVIPTVGQSLEDVETYCNLPGICNFYMKTIDAALLNYFPLEKKYPRLHALYFDQTCRFRKRLLNAADDIEFVEVGPLFPIRTDGDGNCLLHAISICMWGCHDPFAPPDISRQLAGYHFHRRLLYNFLAQHQQMLLLHYKAAGYSF